ncbi:hypothetical protein llap_13244 [Limosa lapponica baueri]|uniref:Uncharacterized protein n=1 Tax=Limosa lapponica baueri TaxID=1758121 RepID=A0A2I0TRM5_LIMLA|nr:hypothetical protein llap_13244 [Limosa lapponica baueri]
MDDSDEKNLGNDENLSKRRLQDGQGYRKIVRISGCARDLLQCWGSCFGPQLVTLIVLQLSHNNKGGEALGQIAQGSCGCRIRGDLFKTRLDGTLGSLVYWKAIQQKLPLIILSPRVEPIDC